MISAISTGRFADFEALAMNGHFGSADPTVQRRLVNPGSGYAYDLEGTDSHQLKLAPAPAFASAQEAGEMAELYWMALLRDTNFADYDSSPLAQAAAADLSKLSDFRGPKDGGVGHDKNPVSGRISRLHGWAVHFAIPVAAVQFRIHADRHADGDSSAGRRLHDGLSRAGSSVQNGVNTPPIPTFGVAVLQERPRPDALRQYRRAVRSLFRLLHQFAQQRLSRESRKSIRAHL